MAFVEVKGLLKTFEENLVAVNRVSFTIENGKLATFLGPSGCGKTTTLRCIGGLDTPDEGDILVDGDYLTSVEKGIFLPPEKRGLGMVFQSYAIWPHMSVFANVSYGLEMQGISKKETRRRVLEVLELVGLHDFADRNATKLSGGQQQRVALARALAFNPRLLLFDEPLSNLDAKLRERMRLSLKKLLKEVGITSIYVTHDQVEAMAISDIIFIMNNGNIVQVDTGENIYNRPMSKFVADFIGSSNFLRGTIEGKDREENIFKVRVIKEKKDFIIDCYSNKEIPTGKEVDILIRPEKILISEINRENGNIMEGKILESVFLGNITEYFVSLGETVFRIQDSKNFSFKPGEKVFLHVEKNDCICLTE